MSVIITIPADLYHSLRKHLFKGNKEQGAFMFATNPTSFAETILKVDGIHPIPEDAWDVHSPYYLELKDEEKAKVMKIARNRDCHLVECHSHRGPYASAQFWFIRLMSTLDGASDTV